VGYCYLSGLEKTLCKWDIVTLVTKGLMWYSEESNEIENCCPAGYDGLLIGNYWPAFRSELLNSVWKWRQEILHKRR
jgi:hypothetical protein